MSEIAGGLLEPKRRSLTVKEMMLEAQKIKKKLRFLVEEVVILCHCYMHIFDLLHI